MSIFIASTKSISRGKGQSAVASASYRAGVELQDKRYGKTHDYSKRFGVMSADIILPSSLKDKNIDLDRCELWNLAEEAENRKDARVAREWLVNLPYELSEEDRKDLAHQFSQELADRYNVIADCAIHKPTQKEIERGADARNFHAHIMLTTRQAELTADNKVRLTEKSTAELSDKKRRELGLERMSVEVKEVRQIWERVANEKLLEHGHDLIDSRSYKEQGIDILPQLKMGVDATHLERRTGIKSDKGIINDIIKERNELVFNREIKENKFINERAEQIIFENKEREIADDRLRKAVERAARYVRATVSNTAQADRNIHNASSFISETEREIANTEHAVNRAERAADRANRAITEATIKEQDNERAEQLSARMVRSPSIESNTNERGRELQTASSSKSNELGQAHTSEVGRSDNAEAVATLRDKLNNSKVLGATTKQKLEVLIDTIESKFTDHPTDQLEKYEAISEKIDQLEQQRVSEIEQARENIERYNQLKTEVEQAFENASTKPLRQELSKLQQTYDTAKKPFTMRQSKWTEKQMNERTKLRQLERQISVTEAKNKGKFEQKAKDWIATNKPDEQKGYEEAQQIMREHNEIQQKQNAQLEQQRVSVVRGNDKGIER